MKFIVHTDGGSRGNPGQAAIGIVIEDENKQVIHEISESIGVTTNNVAEHTAVNRALAFLSGSNYKPDEVLFYLDSLLVAQQLSHRYKINKEDLQQLARSSWQIMSTLPFPVSFHHVLREKNKHADTLVNRALDSL